MRKTRLQRREPRKSFKNAESSGFRSGGAIPVIFWAEKLILVIIYLFQPRKVKINIYTLLVSSNQLYLARFLGDPADFNGPGLPVDQFSIGKKHFFMKINNVRGFFSQQGGRH
jgi:hypothetical protein